jgi:hypothetical protein
MRRLRYASTQADLEREMDFEASPGRRLRGARWRNSAQADLEREMNFEASHGRRLLGARWRNSAQADLEREMESDWKLLDVLQERSRLRLAWAEGLWLWMAFGTHSSAISSLGRSRETLWCGIRKLCTCPRRLFCASLNDVIC